MRLDAPGSRVADEGLPALFKAAFTQSRNAMALVDGHRRHVDVNGAYVALLGRPRGELIGRPIYSLVAGGPLMTPAEWRAALARHELSGQAELIRGDGDGIWVQFAGTTAVVDGRRLVLFVTLTTSRWGTHFRRTQPDPAEASELSPRERDIVRLVALGRSGPEIADELGIAHDTVRTHVRNAMTKAGARSRAHLVARVLAEGLIFSKPRDR